MLFVRCRCHPPEVRIQRELKKQLQPAIQENAQHGQTRGWVALTMCAMAVQQDQTVQYRWYCARNPPLRALHAPAFRAVATAPIEPVRWEALISTVATALAVATARRRGQAQFAVATDFGTKCDETEEW